MEQIIKNNRYFYAYNNILFFFCQYNCIFRGCFQLCLNKLCLNKFWINSEWTLFLKLFSYLEPALMCVFVSHQRKHVRFCNLNLFISGKGKDTEKNEWPKGKRISQLQKISPQAHLLMMGTKSEWNLVNETLKVLVDVEGK